MAHLDVFHNHDPRTTGSRPYLLDAQNDLLASLPSTVVIPLARPEYISQLAILRLNPRININGDSLVLLTQDMAALPRRILKTPVANLSSQRDEILAALDFLFTGF
ncbi:MAG: CcdB family protein [Rhodocyclaceae bacterium]|jgi:toxin CcdB|nr:CcdB family protein [Rhodocyclaceae bacterium]